MGTTRRLTIEPRTVAHAAGLCAALADESVGRYIGGPEVTTVEAMIERITYVNGADPAQWGESWLNWTVIADGEPGRPIVGRVEATVHHRTPRTAEVAYIFGPAWSGKGYATEATAWMLDVLRDQHAVATAYATVDPANEPSIRLLGRLGFEACAVPEGGVGSFDAGDLVFRRALAVSDRPFRFEWRGAFGNDEANALHAEAFETRVFSADEWDWVALTQRHSLGWVVARDRQGALVGFVNVISDGLVHAWLQDTMVAGSARALGVGTELVAIARSEARAAGCEWLHVDFDPELAAFYIDACGFTPTAAGLIALQEDAAS